MTTIKSTNIDSDMITVKLGKGQGHHSCPPAGEVWLDVILREQRGRVNATVPTADLLAALDATANTDVKHRADAYEDATRWQTAAEENERWADEWKRKAEESEANAAAQIETVGKLRAERDEWKARAERWAESKESWKADAAEWQTRAEDAEAFGATAVARAEKAEAALVKVMAWAHDWRDEYGREAFKELDAILDPLRPKPAFTLPTEAGAGIRCTGPTESGLSYFTEMRLFSDGRWRDSEGCAWDAETVLDTFWDHRLLGAVS